MIISHNMQALKTVNEIKKRNENKSEAMKTLSSGLRINRTSDDAAGLSISEKMRSQIRGLSQAHRNIEDGISLIQTAEGAMQEVQDITQRMRELCVQGANDTLTYDDRFEIQKELDELKSEISSIAKSTNFNNINLIDGSIGDKKLIKEKVTETRLESITKTVTETITRIETKDISQSLSVDVNSIINVGDSRNAVIEAAGEIFDVSLTRNEGNKIDIKVKVNENIIKSDSITAQAAPRSIGSDTYGGYHAEGFYNIKSTSDGGYILAGASGQVSGDITENSGSGDFWVMKFDSDLNKQWSKSLGTAYAEGAAKVIETSDNDFIVVGTQSTGTGPNDLNGYAAKLDNAGNVLWQRSYGGSSYEELTGVVEAEDGIFIVGYTDSTDGDLSSLETQQYHRSWLMKIDSGNGDIKSQTYLDGELGFLYLNSLNDVQKTNDGNFISVGGYSGSTYNSYVVKFDSNGTIIWSNTYNEGELNEVKATSDGGYITIGTTRSSTNRDALIIKLNSDGTKAWEKIIDFTKGYPTVHDEGVSIIETIDGGFFLTLNSSERDATYAKLDSNGNLEWDNTSTYYGGPPGSRFAGVVQSASGEYILAGVRAELDYNPYQYINYNGWFYRLSKENSFPGVYVNSDFPYKYGEKDVQIQNIGLTFSDKDELMWDKFVINIKYKDQNQVSEEITYEVTEQVPVTETREITKEISNNLVLQIGPNFGDSIEINIDEMRPEALGMTTGYPRVIPKEDSAASIEISDRALIKISSARASLGAQQNNLEHILSNVANYGENLTAAEMRIRDADIAKEMIGLVKINILEQASGALLMQAKQMPQDVLLLLR